MAGTLAFDAARTALLAMDCQNGIVSIYTKEREAEFIEHANAVLKAARAAGITVIFVQVGFRPGLPEVSDKNKLLSAIKASPQHQKLFEGPVGAIHPKLGPEPTDIVVTKHRASAFTGTDLEMILRAKEVDTVILFGIATSGVVLSTLLDASDLDFKTVVIGDCCADLDPELHDALIARLFPKRGEVMTANEFITAL